MYKFFTGKVLTRHLKQLPLRQGRAQEIANLASKLTEGQGSQNELDQVIYDLYNLDKNQRQLIDQEYRRLKGIFFV